MTKQIALQHQVQPEYAVAGLFEEHRHLAPADPDHLPRTEGLMRNGGAWLEWAFMGLHA